MVRRQDCSRLPALCWLAGGCLGMRVQRSGCFAVRKSRRWGVPRSMSGQTVQVCKDVGALTC